MDIFTADWMGFVLTGLATLFLIGEVLVNMRGLFGILGIGFIVVYFSVYLEPSSFFFMFIIYLVGLLLIIIDGKLVNDGTLAALGVAGMLASVAFAAPDFFTGLYAIIGVLIGGACSFLFLKVFKRRPMWNKIMLKDRLTNEAGYRSLSEEYESLIGKQGLTLNDLRPIGTVEIEQKNYSVISDGQWIPKDTKVEVVQVDGTKILVKQINNQEKTE